MVKIHANYDACYKTRYKEERMVFTQQRLIHSDGIKYKCLCRDVQYTMKGNHNLIIKLRPYCFTKSGPQTVIHTALSRVFVSLLFRGLLGPQGYLVTPRVNMNRSSKDEGEPCRKQRIRFLQGFRTNLLKSQFHVAGVHASRPLASCWDKDLLVFRQG